MRAAAAWTRCGSCVGSSCAGSSRAAARHMYNGVLVVQQPHCAWRVTLARQPPRLPAPGQLVHAAQRPLPRSPLRRSQTAGSPQWQPCVRAARMGTETAAPAPLRLRSPRALARGAQQLRQPVAHGRRPQRRVLALVTTGGHRRGRARLRQRSSAAVAQPRAHVWAPRQRRVSGDIASPASAQTRWQACTQTRAHACERAQRLPLPPPTAASRTSTSVSALAASQRAACGARRANTAYPEHTGHSGRRQGPTRAAACPLRRMRAARSRRASPICSALAFAEPAAAAASFVASSGAAAAAAASAVAEEAGAAYCDGGGNRTLEPVRSTVGTVEGNPACSLATSAARRAAERASKARRGWSVPDVSWLMLLRGAHLVAKMGRHTLCHGDRVSGAQHGSGVTHARGEGHEPHKERQLLRQHVLQRRHKLDMCLRVKGTAGWAESHWRTGWGGYHRSACPRIAGPATRRRPRPCSRWSAAAAASCEMLAAAPQGGGRAPHTRTVAARLQAVWHSSTLLAPARARS